MFYVQSPVSIRKKTPEQMRRTFATGTSSIKFDVWKQSHSSWVFLVFSLNLALRMSSFYPPETAFNDTVCESANTAEVHVRLCKAKSIEQKGLNVLGKGNKE